MEEVHSLRTETQAHVDTVTFACGKIRRELLSHEKASEVNGDVIAASMLSLRRANRGANLTAEELRKKAANARSAMVKPKMRLDNLVYLAGQLKKEIQACRSYTGDYESVDLLPEPEAFPKTDDLLKADDHQRMMVRLEAELAERKRLQTKCAELSTKRRRLEVENNSTSKFIDELPTKIEAVVNALRPVKDFFFSSRLTKGSSNVKLPPFGKLELESMSKLPSALYIVYREAAAFRDAFEDSFSVSIRTMESGPLTGLDLGANDVHAVRLYFREAVDSSRHIEILLRYVSELNVVLLKCSSGTVETTSLRYLFPGDDGSVSPNPQNEHLLMGKNLVEAAGGARPFLFAQLICGLSFPDPIARGGDKADSAMVAPWIRAAGGAPLHARFGAVIQAIRQRAKCFRELSRQLELLQKGASPCSASDAGLPVEPESRFSPWKEISTTGKSATKTYTFEVSRDKMVIKMEVKIRTDYPQKSPEWYLRCEDKSFTRADRLDLVHEIHSYVEEFSAKSERPEQVLGCALKRLQACVDVLVETEMEANKSNTQQLVGRPRWERAFRGPLRRRPFHFNEETQLFEQRKPSSDHLVDADGCLAKITGRDKQELKVKRKGSKSVKKSTKKRPRDADTQATDETLENEVEAMEV